MAGGTLQLREVRVTGHEYGLLSGGDARVDGRASLDRRPERGAGAGAEPGGARGSPDRFSRAARRRPARILRGADPRSSASACRSSGLITRDGRLTLEEATFVGPHSTQSIDGDAIQIRGGHATLSGIRIRDCSGIGILAAEGAAVTLSRSSIGGAGVAGVSVETDASLTAAEISIEGPEVRRCWSPSGTRSSAR